FARPMNVTWHDADLALLRSDEARAVRPDHPRFRSAQRALHFHHVEHGYALGDAHDERHPCFDGFQDSVGSEGRRHIDGAGVGVSFGHRLAYRIEHRKPEMHGTAFARRHTPDHARAIGDGLLRMKASLRPGEALADDAGITIYEN